MGYIVIPSRVEESLTISETSRDVSTSLDMTQMKKKKARVDQTLVERGFFESRERAQRAIMAGGGRMGDSGFTKGAELIEVEAPISIVQPPQFARRGALEIEVALAV